jgi:hypothetical protein
MLVFAVASLINVYGEVCLTPLKETNLMSSHPGGQLRLSA